MKYGSADQPLLSTYSPTYKWLGIRQNSCRGCLDGQTRFSPDKCPLNIGWFHFTDQNPIKKSAPKMTFSEASENVEKSENGRFLGSAGQNTRVFDKNPSKEKPTLVRCNPSPASLPGVLLGLLGLSASLLYMWKIYIYFPIYTFIFIRLRS